MLRCLFSCRLTGITTCASASRAGPAQTLLQAASSISIISGARFMASATIAAAWNGCAQHNAAHHMLLLLLLPLPVQQQQQHLHAIVAVPAPSGQGSCHLSLMMTPSSRHCCVWVPNIQECSQLNTRSTFQYPFTKTRPYTCRHDSDFPLRMAHTTPCKHVCLLSQEWFQPVLGLSIQCTITVTVPVTMIGSTSSATQQGARSQAHGGLGKKPSISNTLCLN